MKREQRALWKSKDEDDAEDNGFYQKLLNTPWPLDGRERCVAESRTASAA